MQSKRSDFIPIQIYLEQLHKRLAGLVDGDVASYIPELSRADPTWFGIVLVTVDGHVYEVGDCAMPFTIQSISKALVFGMALEDHGVDGVLAKIGVEPSGEAFNSISLEPGTGRPRNPMINAGAIATTALVGGGSPEERLAEILRRVGAYTGRAMTVDGAVYGSERDTGHRNRAIAHLLRNAGILDGDPEVPLDTYFRQCAIEVTARDLAMIGACIANGGINPVTGATALASHYVDEVLSVMSTCGMYDYSGNWLLRVGLPAKSGVGGGILAVLPGQFGLGIFSPPLDARGNSVRGLRVCEAISEDFGLHLFRTPRAGSGAVLRAAYSAAQVHSRRRHHACEEALLLAHGETIRVYELQGELLFSSTESVLRMILAEPASVRTVIVDLRQVVCVHRAALRLLAALATVFSSQDRRLLLTGSADAGSLATDLAQAAPLLDVAALLRFPDVDRALEHCEDLLFAEFSAGADQDQWQPLEQQYLCQGLAANQLARLQAIGRPREFAAGQALFRSDEEGHSLFMIQCGVVEIVVAGDDRGPRRLNTVRAGMAVGEFAMVTGGARSAEARAIAPVRCLEVRFADLDDALKNHLLVRLAQELASRLAREARHYRVLGGQA